MNKFVIQVLAVLVLSTLALSIWQMQKLTTEYSVDQFYPKEHALLKSHFQIQKQFQLSAEAPFLFVLKSKSANTWIVEKNIHQLKKLSTSLQERDDVAQVISLTHIEGAAKQDDSLIVGNIFDRVKPQYWAKAVLNNPLLYPLLVSENLQSTLIVVEPRSKDKKGLKISEDEIKLSIKSAFPEVSLLSAGVPILQGHLSDMIQAELSLFLGLITLTFCAVFYILFSHWTAILCALMTLICSNIFALALMVTFKIPMNVLLVTLPVIVSVSVMSLLIHTLHLWSGQNFENQTLMNRFAFSYRTLKEISLPNGLGIITTALGFLALAPSTIPLIREYGWAVALILGIVAMLGQLMMFLSLPFVKPRMRTWFSRPASWALLGTRHTKKILTMTAVMVITGLILLPQLNFSTRLFDDLPVGDEIRTTTEWIDQTFGGVMPLELAASTQINGFWKTPEALNRLSKFSAQVRQSQAVGSLVTVSDFFQGAIPQDQAELSETLFLFSMAEKNPLNSFMSEDGNNLRLSIGLRDIPSAKLNQEIENILKQARLSFPEVSFSIGGMATYAHAINQEVAVALIYDFWQPLVFIGLFLIPMFRSFKWALIACLPNLLPPTLLIASLAISQVQVKPGIALIFSIALGFAFNNTLYILSRLLQLQKKRVKNPLREALLVEANPCLFESVIMLIGFSIFLTSDFSMNQTFGGFMLISIIGGFMADLIFLPAFLKVLTRPEVAPTTIAHEKNFSKIAAGLLIGLLGMGSTEAFALNAQDILKKSQGMLDAKDDEAKVEMTIIEANGDKKKRSLEMKTLRENGFSVMARIQSPADIKNMSFLGQVDSEGNEMQWIYLPSSGQVRRLVTGKTKAGLLGSEISPEDLNSQAIKSASVKLLRSDKSFHWIELTPAADASDYTRVVSKISVKDHLPQSTEYFVGNKLKKTVTFNEYKKVGPVWRAQYMNVQNHLNKRGTEVRLTGIKVNSGLSSDDFTQSQLKEN